MKETSYTDIICKRFCAFYKEGKEELQCGTYLYLRSRYSPAELRVSTDDISMPPSFVEDRTIYDLVCSSCAFVSAGCDYRDGRDSPPCGGYVIVEKMICKKG